MYGALLSSFRSVQHPIIESNNNLFTRIHGVAKWVDTRGSLKNLVAVDEWCPFEWWVLGEWLDKKGEDIQGMANFVAMWEPVWSLAAPLYSELGWQKGLNALLQTMLHQDSNMSDTIDGSSVWVLD